MQKLQFKTIYTLIVYITLKLTLSVSNFKVIKRCNTGFEAKIRETLLIPKFNPTLNR